MIAAMIRIAPLLSIVSLKLVFYDVGKPYPDFNIQFGMASNKLKKYKK
jgi:hypothetical protein